jgi:hypothetical protein
MSLKSISIEVNKVVSFRTMALWNLVKQSLEPTPKALTVSDSVCLMPSSSFSNGCMSSISWSTLQGKLLQKFHRIDAGSWKVIIPSSGPSMQGGREEFHHQVFSLVIDREVLKKFPKSSHVRLGTFSSMPAKQGRKSS